MLFLCAVPILVGLPLPGNAAGSSVSSTIFTTQTGLRFSLHHTVSVRIHLYCCTWMRYVALAIILSDSGERMHRDKVPTQWMQAALFVC